MRFRKFLISFNLFALAALLFSSCSSFRYRAGNAFMEEYAYADALKKYEKIGLPKKYPDIIFKLAECYRQTGNTTKALSAYGLVVNNRNCTPEDRFHYAEVLMKAGKYSEAKNWLNLYLRSASKADRRADVLILACDSFNLLYKDSALYIVKPLPFNVSNAASFSPAYYKEGIAFVSDRAGFGTKNLKSGWTGNRCYDIYTVNKNEKGEWNSPVPLPGNVNSLWNEGPAAFNRDFNAMFFTRNSIDNNKLTVNKKQINELKIYKAVLENKQWNTVGELSFSNIDYSVGHPTISSDGSTIYFVSDKPWGRGGTDIYRVRFINGRWSEPDILNANVNTTGDESFPFLLNDTTLYFASTGRFGFGGFDIYETIFSDDDWQPSRNLGYPVNTSSDDFGYISNAAQNEGYLTSNRNGKTDYIYNFIKLPPKITITGTITSFPGNMVLTTARVMITDSAGLNEAIYPDANGKFTYKLEINKNYWVSVTDKNYFSAIYPISTYNIKSSEVIDYPTALDPIQLNKAKINYKIKFDKKSVVFKKNAYRGLDDEIKLMRENPQIKIELNAYTDSRGGDKDNYDLTVARANACKDYMVRNGIDASRITATGFGETKLINQCKNNIMCIDEEHEENNRVEIKIISID